MEWILTAFIVCISLLCGCLLGMTQFSVKELRHVAKNHKLNSLHKDWIRTELTHAGQRKGCDTGNGTAMTAKRRFSNNVQGNTISSGLWECTPGGFAVKNRANTETVYILFGKAIITDEDGTQHVLVPGTFHTLPKGWSGRWDIVQTLRKLYIITL